MFLTTLNDIVGHGDQRNIHIQLTENKRRLKRSGKRRKASTKSVIDRAEHIFNTGTLNDYTHPKEIDPYWGLLYKQYEFLVYVDVMYRSTLKQRCMVFSNEEINTIVDDLVAIRAYKKCLLGYLLNFMNVMYGSVLQRRFYGWKHYIEDFVSKFNEVAVLSLTRLKFDVDQTRCSVYFYQAFWLSGLSITTKITDDLKRNESSTNRPSNKEAHLEHDFDELYDALGSDAIDTYNTIDDTKHHATIIEEDMTNARDEVEDHVNMDSLEVLENVTEVLAIDKHVSIEIIQTVEEVDFDVSCILNKLLSQLGVSIPAIHTYSDKKLNKLGKIIKKKIATGNLVMHDNDKKLLATLFSSSLLR